MSRSSVKYICYYDLPNALVRRNYVLSAANKLNYIWRVINRAGFDVEVISVSNCIDKRLQYVSGSVSPIDDHKTLRVFPGIGGPKVLQVIGRFWLWICFFFWFVFNVKRGEKVFVYHSLGYCGLLYILKRLTGCFIIGEIEEIYQDVSPQKKRLCELEYQFINNCNAFLFPTHLLDNKFNLSGKPSIIVHGVYEIEESRNVHWDDSEIHVIYAGTFDPHKGGAMAAVLAARSLPRGYHIHICGFGTCKDTDLVKQAIEETNAVSESTVSFEGLKKGEEFIVFLQRCQIGLSTQNPVLAYNATSFPSKILTYLSNGLKVVSIRIPVVECSGVGQCISYYDEQTPSQIAKAILECQSMSMSAVSILNSLDEVFLSEMISLLQLEMSGR